MDKYCVLNWKEREIRKDLRSNYEISFSLFHSSNPFPQKYIRNIVLFESDANAFIQ